MTTLTPWPVGARHLRPDRVSELLTELEGRTAGARHTVMFGTDGVALGHAGDPQDPAVVARAEQSASSAYMLTSLSAGAWRCWAAAATDPDRFGEPAADHLLLRHRGDQEAQRWWVLIVPVPGWGGICTEVPPGGEVAITGLIAPVRACAEQVVAVLEQAHRGDGGL